MNIPASLVTALIVSLAAGAASAREARVQWGDLDLSSAAGAAAFDARVAAAANRMCRGVKRPASRINDRAFAPPSVTRPCASFPAPSRSTTPSAACPSVSDRGGGQTKGPADRSAGPPVVVANAFDTVARCLSDRYSRRTSCPSSSEPPRGERQGPCQETGKPRTFSRAATSGSRPRKRR